MFYIFQTLERAEVFIQEVKTLENVHPQISSILRNNIANYQPFAAKCIYLHKESPHEAIVMEDLNREGFRLANINLGLDIKHCLLVVRTIAQYHAASLVLVQKTPNCFQPFYDNLISIEFERILCIVMKDNLKDCAGLLMKWPGFEGYSETIHCLCEGLGEKVLEANRRDEGGYNVLNHGDLWIKNIMFRYNDLTHEVQDVR